MTNREMVKGAVAKGAAAERATARDRTDLPQPNATPLPPMPAPEDSRTPTTDQEPVDSPQPNASAKRAPPSERRPGLATERE